MMCSATLRGGNAYGVMRKKFGGSKSPIIPPGKKAKKPKDEWTFYMEKSEDISLHLQQNSMYSRFKWKYYLGT